MAVVRNYVVTQAFPLLENRRLIYKLICVNNKKNTLQISSVDTVKINKIHMSEK